MNFNNKACRDGRVLCHGKCIYRSYKGCKLLNQVCERGNIFQYNVHEMATFDVKHGIPWGAAPGGGGGVLPYMTYTGMGRPTGA